MATDPTFVSNYRTESVQFTAAGPHVMVAYAAGPSGSRIHSITGTLDAAGTTLMKFYRGRILTDNSLPRPMRHFQERHRLQAGLTPVLALTNTTNSTITRTNGSFIDDGITVNTKLAVLGSNTNIQNQLIFVPTTVAAATLTATGAIFQAADATPSGMMCLARADLLWSKAMVGSDGYSNTVPALNMMDVALNPSILAAPDGFLTLEPFELLLVAYGNPAVFASVVTLPAAGAALGIVTCGGDF